MKPTCMHAGQCCTNLHALNFSKITILVARRETWLIWVKYSNSCLLRFSVKSEFQKKLFGSSCHISPDCVMLWWNCILKELSSCYLFSFLFSNYSLNVWFRRHILPCRYLSPIRFLYWIQLFFFPSNRDSIAIYYVNYYYLSHLSGSRETDKKYFIHQLEMAFKREFGELSNIMVDEVTCVYSVAWKDYLIIMRLINILIVFLIDVQNVCMKVSRHLLIWTEECTYWIASRFLTLGFELELYSPNDYCMVYWCMCVVFMKLAEKIQMRIAVHSENCKYYSHLWRHNCEHLDLLGWILNDSHFLNQEYRFFGVLLYLQPFWVLLLYIFRME